MIRPNQKIETVEAVNSWLFVEIHLRGTERLLPYETPPAISDKSRPKPDTP